MGGGPGPVGISCLTCVVFGLVPFRGTGDAERDRQRRHHLPFKHAVSHAYNIRS